MLQRGRGSNLLHGMYVPPDGLGGEGIVGGVTEGGVVATGLPGISALIPLVYLPTIPATLAPIVIPATGSLRASPNAVP